MHTVTLGLEDLSSTDDASSAPGFFARLIQSREASANRKAVAYLTSQSNARLAALGFSADDITALRAGDLRIPAVR